MNSKIYLFGKFSYQVSETGEVYSNQKKKLLKIFDNTKGYKTVSLWNGTSAKKFYIHRLVAELFVPNTQNNPEVNHIDGNKENNHYSNLEWVTRSFNMIHARENGYFDSHIISSQINRESWIGLKNSSREVIANTSKKNSAGNYKVVVRCKCSHEFEMYFNDFQKDKTKHCRKCRPKSSYLPTKYSGE